MANRFSFISFLIGLLLGMILMLLLVWLSYFTRSFLFSYCPLQVPYCAGADYFNNPGEALSNGSQIDDILFIDDQNRMLYKRVPKVNNCMPQNNQTINIEYPEYCEFTTDTGTGVWRQTVYGSNIYEPANGLPGPTITTNGNCVPTPGTGAISGQPILQWDPVPLL